MIDREKLVELLRNSFEEQYQERGLITAEHTADYLLANGGTMLRCGEGIEGPIKKFAGFKTIGIEDIREPKEDLLARFRKNLEEYDK